MNTHTDKLTDNKSNAVANNMANQPALLKKQSPQEGKFSETAGPNQMQETIKSSPQVRQLKNVHDLANGNQRSGNLQSANKVAQLEDIEMEEIRPRIATCVSRGVAFEFGKSYSSIDVRASQLQETDRVIYEIAWDASVAPVGHEGMHVVANQASDFITDRSQEGVAIGDVRSRYRRDGANGFVFEYRDGIEWPTEFNGGSWRFRLRVVNGAGTEVARSAVATVNWTH